MPLPFPVRIAAGLVVTAVEQARDLPRLVIEFPVTAVSQALQASMRVQQRVTELAIKGDRVLGTLRPTEEKPSWATFDEDEPPARNGTSTVTELRPSASVTAPAEPEFSLPPAAIDEPEAAEYLLTEALVEELPADELPVDEAVFDDSALDEAQITETSVTEEPAAGGTSDDSLPPALPDYANMTIPQLRGKLRFLSLEDLQALLEWETAHGERPPFLTMLGNRITTVLEG